MKGERTGVQLPLDVFLKCFKRDLMQGAFSSLIKLTRAQTDLDSENDEDFVEGYEEFVQLCIKPLMLSTLEKDLSFVLSASNLTLFCHNYCTAKTFVAEFPEFRDLLLKFNLQT